MVVSPAKNRNEQAYWKVSFEEGVHPSDIRNGAIPDEDFKLVHTQWRYDFGFITPSGISISHYNVTKLHKLLNLPIMKHGKLGSVDPARARPEDS